MMSMKFMKIALRRTYSLALAMPVCGALLLMPGLVVAASAAQSTPAAQPSASPSTAPQQSNGQPSGGSAGASSTTAPQQSGSESAAPTAAEAGSSAPAAPLAAQAPRKVPQAKSQAELDAYQKFMSEKDPDRQVNLIEDFLLKYPDTELKEFAYQAATQAYQKKNDYEKVLTYGELTLEQNPNNLVALLIVSSAIPERTAKNDEDRDEKLQEAETYAKRGLDILEKMPMPPNLTEQEWTRIKLDTESTPHAALGMIALIREDFPTAEAEFKMAIEMNSKPDPITLYRLGLCYSYEKKYSEALDALNRAAAFGGVKVPSADGTSRDLVAEAREYVTKSQAAVAEAPDADANTNTAPATAPTTAPATAAPATANDAGKPGARSAGSPQPGN